MINSCSTIYIGSQYISYAKSMTGTCPKLGKILKKVTVWNHVYNLPTTRGQTDIQSNTKSVFVPKRRSNVLFRHS